VAAGPIPVTHAEEPNVLESYSFCTFNFDFLLGRRPHSKARSGQQQPTPISQATWPPAHADKQALCAVMRA
jgi:hypothetical protein